MDEDLSNAVVATILRAVLLKHLLDITDVLVIAANKVTLIIIRVSCNTSELVGDIVSVAFGTAADSNAGDRAQHDGQADASDVHQNVRDVLLFVEVEERGNVRGGKTSQAHNVTNEERNDRG